MDTRYLYICFALFLGTTLELPAQAAPPLAKQKPAK